MTDPHRSLAVVVPAYNVERYITQCLQSLLDQTYPEWICLVIDDGSTDDTAEQVLRLGDPRIRLVRQANAGVSCARNTGWDQADAEFVMFLDGDDQLHPTALERLSAALVDDPAPVCAYGALRKMLDDGAPYPGEKPLEQARYRSGDVLAAMVEENFLANGGHVLIRSAMARPAGGFATSLQLSEDWEFWCRLALIGPFQYIGAPPEVFRLRVRPSGASGGLASAWLNHLAAIEAVLGNAEIAARFAPKAWRKLTTKVWASHLWECGRVNFTIRRFATARAMMIRSLWRDPKPKRLALFGLAQISQMSNRSLVSRLRFREDDLTRD